MGNCCRKIKLSYYEKLKTQMEEKGETKDVP